MVISRDESINIRKHPSTGVLLNTYLFWKSSKNSVKTYMVECIFENIYRLLTSNYAQKWTPSCMIFLKFYIRLKNRLFAEQIWTDASKYIRTFIRTNTLPHALSMADQRSMNWITSQIHNHAQSKAREECCKIRTNSCMLEHIFYKK